MCNKNASSTNNASYSSISSDQFSSQVITVPHNGDIEAGIIGAVLRDNNFYYDISSIRAEMFYFSAHAKIWELITETINTGNVATPITLKHRVDNIPEIESLGGSIYLARLTFEEFSIISPYKHAKILRDLYQKRQIISICQDTIAQTYDMDTDLNAKQIINQIEQQLFNLNADKPHGSAYSLSTSSQSAIEIITQIYEKKIDLGVTTGFICLNRVIGGIKPSDLIILAARPGMGKTALSISMAVNAAHDFHKKNIDKSVLFFSLEMSAQQLTMRILSDKANITHEKLRLGNLSSEDYDKYCKAAKKVSVLPLFIEENPNLTIIEMRAIIRKISCKIPVGAVFLDYLQLLGNQNKRRNDNRVQEISEITRGLKLLAREFDVPIVALSQLSRQVENREDKTPKLADLRESGSIEQDADVVMFIYRPEYYLKNPELREGENKEQFRDRQEKVNELKHKLLCKATIIVAKNRHGSNASEEMMFYKELIRFSDIPENRYKNAHGFPVS